MSEAAGSTPRTGPQTGDVFVDRMLRENIPLTRKRYFSVAGIEGNPDELQHPELEASLPWRFQHPDFQSDEDNERVTFPPGT